MTSTFIPLLKLTDVCFQAVMTACVPTLEKTIYYQKYCFKCSRTIIGR